MKAELRVWVARTRSTECSSMVPVLCLSWVGDRNRWGGGVNGGGEVAPLPSALNCLLAFCLRACWLVLLPLGKPPCRKKVHVRGSEKVMLCGQSWDYSYRTGAVTELELESLRAPPPLLTTFTRRTHLNFFVVLFPPGHQIHNGRM